MFHSRSLSVRPATATAVDRFRGTVRQTPGRREQGLTVGELLLIVVVVAVTIGGAVMALRSQQPATPSAETQMQPVGTQQP